MTLLVGQNNSSGFIDGHALGTNSRVIWASFVAVVSGTTSTINLWLQPQGGSETFRLGLWTSAFAPITQTVELHPTTGADSFVSGSISASIVSGTTYILGIFASNTASTTNIFYYTDSNVVGSFLDDSSGGGYPVQPTLNTSVAGQAGNIAIYIDGSVGNTSVTPTVATSNITGNSATVVSATNTVVTPFVARKSGILEPDRRMLVPQRKIFLPTRAHKAA